MSGSFWASLYIGLRRRSARLHECVAPYFDHWRRCQSCSSRDALGTMPRSCRGSHGTGDDGRLTFVAHTDRGPNPEPQGVDGYVLYRDFR